MTGQLIAVVGPSGVGKDSLIDGLATRDTTLRPVRRVITRPGDAGGEDFESVDEETFAERVSDGDFCLHWEAHGLRYGIPSEALVAVSAGEWQLANLSRGSIEAAAHVFPALTVLSVTAAPHILAVRLSGRGRETPEEIARRLARPGVAPPRGVRHAEIDNSGTLDMAVTAALAAIYGPAA
ncbi:MAG: phosphonate metabolism protein/1,5-bisphosphokinase (PRPP-forming) PhnN [Jannaschia sp.]